MTEPGESRHQQDDRRRTAMWLWLMLAVAVLLFLLSLCTGGGSQDPDALPAPSAPVPTQPAATPQTETLPPGPAPAADPPGPPASDPPPETSAPTTVPPSTTGAAPIDISGTWSFIVDVTVATGACEGEEGDEPVADAVVIAQDGANLTVTGLNGEGPAWEGEISGNAVTFGGERAEDAGTTTAFFIMEVDGDGTVMGGTEQWTWSGPGGSCPDSLSEVTAQRTG